MKQDNGKRLKERASFGQPCLRSLTEKSNPYWDVIERFFIENSKALAILAAMSMLLYGLELFNFNLSIDDELWAVQDHSRVFLSDGRWMLYLLTKALFPFVVVPVVPFAVGLAGVVLGTVIIFRAYGVRKTGELIFLGALTLGFPSLAYIFSFDSVKFGIGIGYFFLAVALLLFLRKELWSKIICATLIGMTIAIYQSMAMAALIVLMIQLTLWVLETNPTNSEIARKLIEIFAIILMALLIYFAIGKLVQWAYNVEARGYLLKSFFDYKSLIANPVKALSDSLLVALVGYGVIGDLHLGAKFGLRLLLVLCGSVILYRTWGHRTRWLLLGIFTSWLFLMPFSLTLLNGGKALPWRTHIEMPIAYAGMVLVSLNISKQFTSKIFKYLVLMLGCLAIFNFSVTDNRLFGSSYMTLQTDRIVAMQLISEIQKKIEQKPGGITQFEAIGFHPAQKAGTLLQPKSEQFGTSFFEESGGESNRMVAFFKTMSDIHLSAAPLEKRVAISNSADSNSNNFKWPDPRSVFVYEDVVVVRFGDYTPQQFQLLCANGSKMPVCANH